MGHIGRREFIQASVGTLTLQGAPISVFAAASPIVSPEQFGAKGDARTNDTAAFAKMTKHVNSQGGGTVVLRPTVYVVGAQDPRPYGGYSFYPLSIMDFRGCTRPLSILGHGARMRCADGLRFGTFEAGSGTATKHSTPFYKPGEITSPYFAMILIEGCSGGVQISDIELDGNIGGMKIGGPWGDVGWQIPCAGLRLKNNLGPITVSNVRSHHHAQDGGAGEGLGRPGKPEMVTIEDCRFSSNGRNGWSHVGGVGWTFRRCVFEKSAHSLPFPGSAPKSGIDLEAEGGKSVADIQLIDCIAEDNRSAGCVIPGTNVTSNIRWTGGRIVGTTAWSYYGGGDPEISFHNTLFLGALVNLTKERFVGCTFSDEVKRSPTGLLYNPSRFIIPDARATNRFKNCSIIHSTPGLSTNGSVDQAFFDDCAFYSLRGAGRLDVYGHFRGTKTRFIAEPGGTDFQVTPDGLGGTKSAGHAEDSFSITTTDGRTVIYSPRRPSR